MHTASVELRDVSKWFSDHAIVRDVSFSVRRGEFFSLLGPSGCGKTTTLRMIAGFESPDRGDILFDGQRMNDVPVRGRDVNMVFQNYALFPHMTVHQNIAFGLEMARIPPADRHLRVAEALRLVRLERLETRYPRQLSGGQQQRAALARALVTHPALLLLDEPLGALDLKLRKEMQLELKALQRRLELTFIYVTHDQEEALSMSDRVAVMHDGAVWQIGTPQEIYERPINRLVADFIGESNFLEVEVEQAVPPLATLLVNGVRLKARCDAPMARGSGALLALRPERVVVSREPLTADNQLAGRITAAAYLGTDMRYAVQVCEDLCLTVRQQNQAPGTLQPGDTVYLSWPAEGARVLPPDDRA